MSFRELLNLIRRESAEIEAHKARTPLDCPRCGKPWTSGPNGELHCTFDGTIWTGATSHNGQ